MSQVVKQAQEDIKKSLDVLNGVLATRTFLVGERVTLADITVACNLLLAYRQVTDMLSDVLGNISIFDIVLQVFAIELVTFAVGFVPLAVEFGIFAVEFVGFAVQFVALALKFIALAMELSAFALET